MGWSFWFNKYLFSKLGVPDRLAWFPGFETCQHFNYTDSMGQEELDYGWQRHGGCLCGRSPSEALLCQSQTGRRVKSKILGQNVKRHLKVYEPKHNKVFSSCFYWKWYNMRFENSLVYYKKDLFLFTRFSHFLVLTNLCLY